MKPNTPVHYQKGNTLQKGNPPLPTYNLLPLPPPPQFFLFLYHMDYNSVTRKDYTPTPPPPPPPIFIFKFYFICTNIVLQEKIIPL